MTDPKPKLLSAKALQLIDDALRMASECRHVAKCQECPQRIAKARVAIRTAKGDS